MYTFDDGQPEEFLDLPRNWKITTDGTGTTSHSGWVDYLHTLLRGVSLKEFNELTLQGNTTNNHLKHITEGLIEYFPSMNVIPKHKSAIRRAIRKPRKISLKQFTEQLTEINNFLTLFPIYDPTKKMTTKELNETLLHAVPNG